MEEKQGNTISEQTTQLVNQRLANKLQFWGLSLERAYAGWRVDQRSCPIVARLSRYIYAELVTCNAARLKGTYNFVIDDLCPTS